MSYRMRTDVRLEDTEKHLGWCFEKWGVRDYSVDYNMPEKGRDAVASRYFQPSERGVTVRWRRPDGSPVVLSMDAHERPRDNLRVLYLAIDSIRLNEKRGVDAGTMRSAYLQLNAPADENPYQRAGIRPGMTRDEALQQYRAKAKDLHPDLGGTDEQMAALNAAWRRVQELEGWA